MRIHVLFTIALLATSCSDRERSPNVYLLPENFSGWTCIDFDRPECPETPYVDGKWVFSFPSTGYLCTSSTIEYGRAKDEWYFLANNKRIPVPGYLLQHGGVSNVGSSTDNPESTVQSMFIGEYGTHNQHEYCDTKVKKNRKSG